MNWLLVKQQPFLLRKNKYKTIGKSKGQMVSEISSFIFRAAPSLTMVPVSIACLISSSGIFISRALAT